MSSTELERAEQQMQQKWYELVQAEQQGSPRPVLEQLYTSYITAVEEYNRCATPQRQEHVQPLAVPKQRRVKSSDAASIHHRRRKKAS